MKNILRILLSGLIAGLITAGTMHLELIGIIPTTIEGTLNSIYINKELIILFYHLHLCFFFKYSFSTPIS